MSGNLFERLVGTAGQDEAGPFLETADGETLSLRDLLDEAGRIAALLRAEGVKPGERVTVQVEKSVRGVALYLAVLQIGAIHVPLNTAYTAVELDYFIGDAGPAAVVCDPASEAAVAPLAERAGAKLFTLDAEGKGSLEAASGLAPDLAITERDGGDVAAILYTSGTTGRSKGAMLTHDNLWSNVAVLYAAWGFRSGDVLIHALPLYHTHGLFVALNLMLLNRGKVMFLPRFDAGEVLDLMPRATVMMGVPTYYTRLLASERLNRETAAGMRLFVSGSAPLLAQTHIDFAERTGHRILERYGMTETGMNTSNPLDGERRAGTVGLALPGVELRICDTEGAKVDAGGVGVLEVRGPNVFKGYWKMPEKTAEEFRPDGFFITGDIATIGEDGYVTIVGRAKDLIISGGLNIYPKEIESVIDDLPGVVESAVVGVPHPDFGEAVVAVLTGQCDPGEVLPALRGQLAGYKLPKHVAMIDSLPRNTMGKVQKNVLREQFQDLFT